MQDVSQWYSIRPWRPTLSLSVREITSVSATFILSSPLALDEVNGEPSFASIGLSTDEDDPDGDSSSVETRHSQIVSDVLSKGLSVKVNGTPWQRVLMKIDDEADEAVIILFGLMPGRQYDIELGIVPGDKKLKGEITTEPTRSPAEGDPNQETTLSDAISQNSSIISTQADGSSQPSGISRSPSPSPSFSLEDRRLQLTHTLSVLTTEHNSLQATLKSARRDAQKADAALRAEIDALKRASERAAPAELRAKQKALALQEAVRQALATAEAFHARAQELEEALPELVRRKSKVEREWEQVRKEADAIRSEKEAVQSRERKRTESMQSELNSLAGRLEKLSTKREKLEGEGGAINELEEKLRRLEEERERIETDPYGYSYEQEEDEDTDGMGEANRSGEGFSHQLYNSHVLYHPHQSHSRKRHSHPSQPIRPAPPPIARPDPIQRPSPSGRPNFPPGPGIIHLQPSSHGHTHSLPAQSFKRAAPLAASSVNSSISGLPSIPTMPANSSNLSSRAPPFEPRVAKSELNPDSSPFEPRGTLPGLSGIATKTNGSRTSPRSTKS